MKYVFFWSIPLLLLCSSRPHPLYVSVCEIDYNPHTHHLEIALRVFIDDLERGLMAAGAPSLYLGTPEEHPRANAYLEAYLRRHLVFQGRGTALPVDYLGRTTEQDVLWCYLEVKEVPPPPVTLSLTHTLLLEVIETQKNIVYFRYDGKQQNLLLHKSQVTGELVLSD